MLRRLQTLFVLGICAVSIPVWAAEPNDTPQPKGLQVAQADTGAPGAVPPNAPDRTAQPTEASPTAPAEGSVQPTVPPSVPPPPPPVEVKPDWSPKTWQTEITGYFRAPVAFGISSRPNPDNPTGPSHTQVTYAPNRVVDSSYYAFTYTRLQETDWAELFIHEKHKHVDAVIGWMGYWFQSIGVRNPDAAWAPGMAYLTLDTDFEVAGYKPNVELTTGAWWPKFGYFEKYDTYTLGRFRQIGEQTKLTVPITPDLKVSLIQGFGTGRDGSFTYSAPPLYGVTTGLDLLTWENIQVTYKKNIDIGIHYNTQWTADPTIPNQTVMMPKSYTQAATAHLTVVGAEANLSAPMLGHLWISPSYINVVNGWALAGTGTEVMHSLGGLGIATNYMAWTGSPSDSTGSGTMFNLGFLYENTLSGIQNRARGSMLPDVTLSLFGLLSDSNLDLPPGTSLTQNSLKEFKYGADVTVQVLESLGFMLRFDSVNMDMDHGGYIFAAITPRVQVSSHYLSGERVYLQYSRYFYGDKMTLGGTWPWGAPIVAGSDILQGGPYVNKTPDEDVVKFQAEVAF